MRKNNLWITALAFGLSLSAYGQQAEGGISSGMLQEIKQAYKGTRMNDILVYVFE